MHKTELLFSLFFKFVAWGSFAIPISIFIALVFASAPAMSAFGFEFLVSDDWDPYHLKFGALTPVWGTFITSLIAMLIAVPTSLGISVFVAEFARKKLGQFTRSAIELMAGIPSIIYGMWGLFVLSPVIADYVQAPLGQSVENIFLLNVIFGGSPSGIGIFTASFILSIMITPYVSSAMIDLFRSLPPQVREASYGIGMTRFEYVTHIVVPFARNGFLGSVMIGLGRALGETMAVTFIIGNSPQISASLFSPATTISSTIANEFGEATHPHYVSSLMELALVLFVISVIVIGFARLMLLPFKKKSV